MRRVTENYSIEETGGGYVVRTTSAARRSTSARTDCGTATQRHADPFTERHYAEQKIEQERGDQ
jgi:hypothetical protein